MSALLSFLSSSVRAVIALARAVSWSSQPEISFRSTQALALACRFVVQQARFRKVESLTTSDRARARSLCPIFCVSPVTLSISLLNSPTTVDDRADDGMLSFDALIRPAIKRLSFRWFREKARCLLIRSEIILSMSQRANQEQTKWSKTTPCISNSEPCARVDKLWSQGELRSGV